MTSPAVESSRRLLDIQGLRGIAVLAVVVFHAGLPLPGGFTGVDMFFVISGFVITAMLEREYRATGTVRLGRFFARRVRRLGPALAVVVIVTVLLSVVVSVGMAQLAAQTGIAAALISANIVIARTTGDYFDAAAASNPLLHTWSLAVEEQFYLVFPFVLLGGWWLGRRSRRPLAALALVAAVGVISLVVALADAAGLLEGIVPATLVGYYGPLGRVWEFAVGAALALAVAAGFRLGARAAVAASLLGAVLLLAGFVVISGAVATPGVSTLLPVMGTALLILGSTAASPTTGVRGLLRSRPLVVLGDLSYSWYLWHWPVVVFTAALLPGQPWAVIVAAAASLLPAIASYRWVEQPMRIGGSPMGNRHVGGSGGASVGAVGASVPRLVALVTLPTVVIPALVLAGASAGFGIEPVQRHQASVVQVSPNAARAAGCTGRVDPATRAAGECTWNAGSSGGPVYLLGDSHGDQLSDGVIEAAISTGRSVTTAIQHGCPYTAVPVAIEGDDVQEYASCATSIEASWRWLDGREPGTIIVAFSDHYWSDPRFGLLEGGAVNLDRELALVEQQAWLTSVVRSARDGGHEVVLVAALPVFDSERGAPFTYRPRECSLPAVIAERCRTAMPESVARQRQAPMRNLLDAVAARTGADVLDLWAPLCPEGTCRTWSNSDYVFRDALHIGAAASASLAPHIAPALSATTTPSASTR